MPKPSSTIKRTTHLKKPVTLNGTIDKRYKVAQFTKTNGTRDKRTILTFKRK